MVSRRGLALGAGVLAYVGCVRPWMMRWGSTDEERCQALPGDAVIPDATTRVTRAIDIAAPPVEVWPWLVQLGYGPGRAGFYSYDWLDNLIGLDVHSADRLAPEQPAIVVGDRIPLGPETDFVVEHAEPESALVLHCRMHPFKGRNVDPANPQAALWLDWTWAFVLRPAPPGTRLFIRTRGAWQPRILSPVIEPILDPVWFVMERRMLLGIRERAEAMATGGT